MEFLKEVSTVPEKISPKDYSIYKAINVRNDGVTQWPQNTILFSVGEVGGSIVKVTPLNAQKDTTLMVIINSPKKVGQYHTRWCLGFEGANGQTMHIGQPIVLSFEVNDPQPKVQYNSVDLQILKD
jgi:hypothetical protein